MFPPDRPTQGDALVQQLRAENERLRDALERIIHFAEANGMQDWTMTKIARNAMQG